MCGARGICAKRHVSDLRRYNSEGYVVYTSASGGYIFWLKESKKDLKKYLILKDGLAAKQMRTVDVLILSSLHHKSC